MGTRMLTAFKPMAVGQTSPRSPVASPKAVKAVRPSFRLHAAQESIDPRVQNSSPSSEGEIGIDSVLENNRKWSAAVRAAEPEYFSKLAEQQAPEFLWIGCADSRVPANQILGLAPGEVFVQRNVGNLATHKDMNAMACLEFAVDVLKVKHIIICGHLNCGAVKGALTLPANTKGLVNLWISDIRDTRNKYQDSLMSLNTMQERWDRLCELNVVRQLYNICTSPTVQAAWDRNQPITVHAFVYSLADGLLKEVAPPVSGQVSGSVEDMTPKAALDKAFSTFSYFETAARS
jgi:carbonic anhydrase